jgi:uncharacterized alkaline shock family protein YloU
MKGHMNTKNGSISIDNQVIAKYAGICALGCFGIVGMAMVNMKDGIVKMLTRDNIRKGVFVSVTITRSRSIFILLYLTAYLFQRWQII